MVRTTLCWLAAAAAILITTCGCCVRRGNQTDCCPPFVKSWPEPAVSTKQEDAGVEYDFGQVDQYDNIRRVLLDQIRTEQPLRLDLAETLCTAAYHSELADLIDAERHALQCQADNGCRAAVDQILEGQSLEQRNESAGAAGELFLRLVQFRLQRELIEESRFELDQLEQKLNAAAQAGFAIAQGRDELEGQRNKLRLSASQLEAAEQATQYQLNQLLGNRQSQIVTIDPVFELAPAHVELDVGAETSVAETNRPGLRSLESAIACSANDPTLYELLSQFDPRLGIRMPAGKLKLVDLMCDDNSDPTVGVRREQASQTLGALRRTARAEASQAMLQIQTSFESLALHAEDIDRLSQRIRQLEAGREVFNGELFLQLEQVRADRQNARSELIKSAIEFEIGKLKLMQAQGRLVDECRGNTCLCQEDIVVPHGSMAGRQHARSAF